MTPTATTNAPSASDSPAKWIDAGEAARRLRVSVRGVQRRCRAGKLPARLVATPSGQQWEINAQALARSEFDPDTPDRDDTQAPTQTTGTTQKTTRTTEETTPNDTNDTLTPTGTTQGTTQGTNGPDTDFAARYVAQIETENRFLKSQIEEGNRNAAELRAALRKALEIAPRQLGQGSARVAPERDQDGATNTVPEATPNASESKRNAPMTYADVVDQLEREIGKNTI